MADYGRIAQQMAVANRLCPGAMIRSGCFKRIQLQPCPTVHVEVSAACMTALKSQLITILTGTWPAVAAACTGETCCDRF